MSFSTTSSISVVVHWSTATPRSSSTEMIASVLASSSHDQFTLVGIQIETMPSASIIEVQLAVSKTTMPPASPLTEHASPRNHVKLGLSPWVCPMAMTALFTWSTSSPGATRVMKFR